jgi:hypothetical protein
MHIVHLLIFTIKLKNDRGMSLRNYPMFSGYLRSLPPASELTGSIFQFVFRWPLCSLTPIPIPPPSPWSRRSPSLSYLDPHCPSSVPVSEEDQLPRQRPPAWPRPVASSSRLHLNRAQAYPAGRRRASPSQATSTNTAAVSRAPPAHEAIAAAAFPALRWTRSPPQGSLAVHWISPPPSLALRRSRSLPRNGRRAGRGGIAEATRSENQSSPSRNCCVTAPQRSRRTRSRSSLDAPWWADSPIISLRIFL